MKTTNSTPPLFPAVIPLNSLNGTQGFRIVGESKGGSCGYSIFAAHVNPDKYADVIIGSPDDNGHIGSVYIFYGNNSIGENGTVFLSNLNGENGFKITGETISRTGSSVSFTRRFNGRSGILIGAPGYMGNTGRGYIVFNDTLGAARTLSLTNLTRGFKFVSEDKGDFCGTSISSGSDIQGDGSDEILIGAPGRGNISGQSYVVSGGGENASFLSLKNLNGHNGFVIYGISSTDYSGYQLQFVGDLNSDGHNDIAVSAPYRNNRTGSIFIVYGGFIAVHGFLSLENLNGDNGFEIVGEAENDFFGWSIGSGDFNRDGLIDLLVGAPFNNGTGCTYLIFNSPIGFPMTQMLMSNYTSNITKIKGASLSDASGFSVSNAGDINYDGYEDIAIGAKGYKSSTGTTYLVYGSPTLSTKPWLSLSQLRVQDGFRLDGEGFNHFNGFSVTKGGDINGDGIDDLLTTSTGYGGTGCSYVLFGRSAFPPTLPPTPTPSHTPTFTPTHPFSVPSPVSKQAALLGTFIPVGAILLTLLGLRLYFGRSTSRKLSRAIMGGEKKSSESKSKDSMENLYLRVAKAIMSQVRITQPLHYTSNSRIETFTNAIKKLVTALQTRGVITDHMLPKDLEKIIHLIGTETRSHFASKRCSAAMASFFRMQSVTPTEFDAAIPEIAQKMVTRRLKSVEMKITKHEEILKNDISRLPDLCLLKDDTQPEEGKLYLRGKDQVLEYKIISVYSKKPESGKITQTELGTEYKIPDPFNLESMQPVLTKIVDIISERGHTLDRAPTFLRTEIKHRDQLQKSSERIPSPSLTTQSSSTEFKITEPIELENFNKSEITGQVNENEDSAVVTIHSSSSSRI